MDDRVVWRMNISIYAPPTKKDTNYIWVIDNFIGYLGALYIKGFTVV